LSSRVEQEIAPSINAKQSAKLSEQGKTNHYSKRGRRDPHRQKHRLFGEHSS
jgi:hypothetical protein